jgi:hypothetical protein
LSSRLSVVHAFRSAAREILDGRATPATVENRTNICVCLPTSENNFARVNRVMSFVTAKL